MLTLRFLLCLLAGLALETHAAELLAGASKVEITDRSGGTVNDPLFTKALVLREGATTLALITLDAVAIGEIGRIGNGFLSEIRARLEAELGIPPGSVVINASHCHGIVRADTADLTVRAVKEAFGRLAPARTGTASGEEHRISENRRLKMKDGSEVDMRRSYSLPNEDQILSVGPIDSQVGVLRVEHADGRPLAVLYNFACHPIMNPPYRGNSADFPGFASKVLEDTLGGGAVALFVQGCAGDINPVRYKELNQPPDAELLGNRLGLNVHSITRAIQTQPASTLVVRRETIAIPRGTDLSTRISAIQAEQARVVAALKPTNINFKSFMRLWVGQKLAPSAPSHHLQSYLHDKTTGDDLLERFDADNQAALEAYQSNIAKMEQLTRLNTNLALLKKHLAQNDAANSALMEVELMGVRIGSFKLVTFPGELTVQVGLNIKKATNDANAYVAGYTNGYIYYAPTLEQRKNTGYAQEDCDSLVSPEWQQIFERKAVEILKGL